MGLVKESLRKILIRGEYDEYPEDANMHCTARLAEMLDELSKSLVSSSADDVKLGNFLMEEIRVLEEAKGIGLPNFLSRTAFLTVLHKKVQMISETPVEFMIKVWGYLEGVILSVLTRHCDNYPTLQCSSRRAAGNLISRMKDQSVFRVKEIVQTEKYADYTCDPEYISVWNRFMLQKDKFISTVKGKQFDMNKVKVTSMEIETFGKVGLGHLENQHLAEQAFDMKMRLTSYWKIVLKRLVDSMALHLLFSIQNLVNNDLELEIVNELTGYGGGIERLLEESPSVAGKRDRLLKSIKLLKESKEVLGKIMDRIAVIE
ncbi:Dynamin-related protein 4C [Bienertia sinuspersici]